MGIEFLRHPSFRYPFSLGLLFLGAVFGLSCDSDLTGPSKNDPVQEWSFDYEPPAFFYDIWGSGPGDIFLASGSGNVAHLDGTLLTEMGPRGEFGRIRGIWGTSSNDVVAVSGDREIIRFDGTEWTLEASGFSGRLYDVWVDTSGEAFATHSISLMMHPNQEPCTKASHDRDTTLAKRSVHGLSFLLTNHAPFIMFEHDRTEPRWYVEGPGKTVSGGGRHRPQTVRKNDPLPSCLSCPRLRLP